MIFKHNKKLINDKNYKKLLSLIREGTPKHQIMNIFPHIKYCIYKNSLIALKDFSHPGGSYIIQQINGREIDCFIFGGYQLEHLSIPPHLHSNFAEQYFIYNQIGSVESITDQYNIIQYVSEQNQHANIQISPLKKQKISAKSSSTNSIENLDSQNLDQQISILLVQESKLQVREIYEAKIASFSQISPQANKYLFQLSTEFNNTQYKIKNIQYGVEWIGKHYILNIKGHFKKRLYTNVICMTKENIQYRAKLFAKGQYVIFAGGTGIFPFLDLLDFLLRKSIYMIAEKQKGKQWAQKFIDPFNQGLGEVLNDFKLTVKQLLNFQNSNINNFFDIILIKKLFVSFNDSNEFFGRDIIEPLALLNRKYSLNLVNVCLRFSNKPKILGIKVVQETIMSKYIQKFDQRFIQKELDDIELEEIEKVWVCGPPQMQQTVPQLTNEQKQQLINNYSQGTQRGHNMYASFLITFLEKIILAQDLQKLKNLIEKMNQPQFYEQFQTPVGNENSQLSGQNIENNVYYPNYYQQYQLKLNDPDYIINCLNFLKIFISKLHQVLKQFNEDQENMNFKNIQKILNVSTESLKNNNINIKNNINSSMITSRKSLKFSQTQSQIDFNSIQNKIFSKQEFTFSIQQMLHQASKMTIFKDASYFFMQKIIALENIKPNQKLLSNSQYFEKCLGTEGNNECPFCRSKDFQLQNKPDNKERAQGLVYESNMKDLDKSLIQQFTYDSIPKKTHEGIIYEPGLQQIKKDSFELKQLEKPDNKFKIQTENSSNKQHLKIEEQKKTNQQIIKFDDQINLNQQQQQDEVKENDILMLDSADSESDEEYYKNQQDNMNIENSQKKNINQNQNNLDIKEEKKESDTDIQLFSSSDEDEDENENQHQQLQITNNQNQINLNEQKSSSNNSDEKTAVNNMTNQNSKRTVKLFTKNLLKIGNDSVMRKFLTTPLVKGYEMQCYIKREKSGLNWFQPKYHMMLSDGGVYLMSAKKLTANKSTNITIIQQNMAGVEKSDDFSKQTTRFIGKLRGDFKGNFYTLYDTGLNPKKTKDQNVHRRQLGFYAYENKFSDQKQPTKMKAILPKVDFKTFTQTQEFLGQSQKDDLRQKYIQLDEENTTWLQTKPPLYSEQHKTYYLNFGPRIQKQSIKNYQVIEKDGDPENVLLLSGRSYKDDIFVLDFAYPFSPIQAFALALTGFVYKA
ncbi:Tubby C-terminal-like domain [Pseudocohnilembus persalinus]|uniref:Tubby C-terminal-like domain n=1 Tax=Pseudocohnilembus persalinus TaxID=266149 RepID=A0A0V0R807_PSEPJ|nr:Tubby C-terminal-like domain [Pseudocohnilembus persalinus]|eukprot:KRX10636.1 Tubby C-terminal-like domain [Pseudocohnilembus persalinus]